LTTLAADNNTGIIKKRKIDETPKMKPPAKYPLLPHYIYPPQLEATLDVLPFGKRAMIDLFVSTGHLSWKDLNAQYINRLQLEDTPLGLSKVFKDRVKGKKLILILDPDNIQQGKEKKKKKKSKMEKNNSKSCILSLT
jgi:hypothetical protein